MDRPGLQKLLADIAAHRVNVVVVYKVDRLTRSLADFAKIIETFDGHQVSFVSVTQKFNTTSSMGRLTLNVLLSFAQFEREVTGERIRDKIAASKQKGMWMGGCLPLGYDSPDRKLIINEVEAKTVRHIYQRYLELGCVRTLKVELDQQGYRSKIRTSVKGNVSGGKMFECGALYAILKNRIYMGDIVHKDKSYPGEHEAIVDAGLWRAVQDKLEQNRVDHKQGKGVRNPSLLAGLLYDEQGQRLTPSHAQKGDRRYRYYIGGASNMRLPVSEIETAVMSELKLFLKTPQTLIKELAHENDDVGTQQHLAETGKQQAETLKSSDIQNMVQRVEIGKQTLTITCSKSKVRNWLLNENIAADDTFTLSTKFTLRRRGVETKFILDQHASEPCIDQALIKVVAQGYQWNKQLQKGDFTSIAELANKVGVSRPHVSRVIKLGGLAPDIVETILAREQPPSLTAQKFTHIKDFPLDWNDQREAFGFSASKV